MLNLRMSLLWNKVQRKHVRAFAFLKRNKRIFCLSKLTWNLLFEILSLSLTMHAASWYTVYFFCYKPLLTQTKHYVFFQIYSPANISNIYRPYQFEKVHSERFQSFFFKPLLTQTWVVRGVNRSENFGRILKFTFTGQPDGGGVQKARKVNFYCKNQKYILINYQV